MAKNENKALTLGIGLVAVVVAVIIIVMTLTNNNSLNDSFFVSDNTKYVFTLDGDEISSDEGVPAPTKGYIVYFYEGDKITDMKAYYKFTNSDNAQKMQEYYQENGTDNYKSIVRNGEYIILTANPSEYNDLTASEVKAQIDFLQELQTMEIDTGNDEDTSDEGDEEIIIDTGEEE